ncbi:MAG: DUF2778 domain-containing protein [Magnetococcales bacterium]|nr:DUF2778 domain-containing protein [Magnetococcales bacterium]
MGFDEDEHRNRVYQILETGSNKMNNANTEYDQYLAANETRQRLRWLTGLNPANESLVVHATGDPVHMEYLGDDIDLTMRQRDSTTLRRITKNLEDTHDFYRKYFGMDAPSRQSDPDSMYLHKSAWKTFNELGQFLGGQGNQNNTQTQSWPQQAAMMTQTQQQPMPTLPPQEYSTGGGGSTGLSRVPGAMHAAYMTEAGNRIVNQVKESVRNVGQSLSQMMSVPKTTRVVSVFPGVAEPPEPGVKSWLAFNGDELAHFVDGKKVKSWAGVSGKDEFQDAKYQDMAAMGPIPEGKWDVKQKNHQKFNDLTMSEQATSWIGGGLRALKVDKILKKNIGKWPGGTVSWGDHRVWLKPAPGVETYNRSGFTIHGGWTPGSAGCIDLTDKMDDFADWFMKHGQDVPLYVKYGKNRK